MDIYCLLFSEKIEGLNMNVGVVIGMILGSREDPSPALHGQCQADVLGSEAGLRGYCFGDCLTTYPDGPDT